MRKAQAGEALRYVTGAVALVEWYRYKFVSVLIRHRQPTADFRNSLAKGCGRGGFVMEPDCLPSVLSLSADARRQSWPSAVIPAASSTTPRRRSPGCGSRSRG